MKGSLHHVCFLLFMLLVAKASKSDTSLRRLIRAIDGRSQNTSLYNIYPNLYTKPSDGIWPQGSNPDSRYAQGYDPNNPSYSGPHNGYGYNTYPNKHFTSPPRWNNSDPGRQNYPGNNHPDGYPYNSNPNGYYTRPPAGNITGLQWNNPRDLGWNAQPPSGYNAVHNSTSPPWQNPRDNYYPGHLTNPSYPSYGRDKPQNTSWYNPNYNGYTSQPPTWKGNQPQGNYHVNQYQGAPNDLMIHHYKRSIGNRRYNASLYNIDSDRHSNKDPRWNHTSSHWNGTRHSHHHGNSTGVNYTALCVVWICGYDDFRNRQIRSVDHSRHSNISWHNIDPSWYYIKPSGFNGTHWNRPGSHYYQWDSNDTSYEHRHHHHRHHHNHGPPPPQFGPPPPYGPPPPNGPPNNFGPRGAPGHRDFYPYYPSFKPVQGNDTTVNGTASWSENAPGFNNTDLWVPEVGAGSNNTVINGTYPWPPENGPGLNSTNWLDIDLDFNCNNTNPWGPEITDLNKSDQASTPSPV